MTHYIGQDPILRLEAVLHVKRHLTGPTTEEALLIQVADWEWAKTLSPTPYKP